MDIDSNFHDGKFRNTNGVTLSLDNMVSIIKRYIFEERVAEPPVPIPVAPLAEELRRPPTQPTLFRLGHSSVLIFSAGNYWLTDPIFSRRASMVQWAGPARFHEPPISIDELPPIKGVFISHNHYDHLDKNTIKALHPIVERFYVPLGVDKKLSAWGVPEDKVIALDWWDEVSAGQVQIVATPAQHFSGRGLFDSNETLWTSWVFIAPDLKLYYSGDTGYFEGFKEIGERYGPFDATLIETGAYDKDWPDVHMMPEQSLQAHRDLGGKLFIPVHNGTFDLALHDWNDPFIQIQNLAGDIRFAIPKMGEAIVLSNPPSLDAWWQMGAEKASDAVPEK